MRDYLKNDERMQLLTFSKSLESINHIINWNKYNMLTKEESKSLKLARTYGFKAIQSIVARLDKTTVKQIYRNMKNGTILYKDDHAMRLLNIRFSSDLKAHFEENKDYYTLVEWIMYHNCAGCVKENTKCGFYREFVDKQIPVLDEDNIPGKCKYSLLKNKFEEEFMEEKNEK